MKTKYVVVESTPGYMPDSDPIECTSKKEAGQIALGLARELREDGYFVYGNMQDGYDCPSYMTLGRVIEILPV
jgi:hypothetical protein